MRIFTSHVVSGVGSKSPQKVSRGDMRDNTGLGRHLVQQNTWKNYFRLQIEMSQCRQDPKLSWATASRCSMTIKARKYGVIAPMVMSPLLPCSSMEILCSWAQVLLTNGRALLNLQTTSCLARHCCVHPSHFLLVNQRQTTQAESSDCVCRMATSSSTQ